MFWDVLAIRNSLRSNNAYLVPDIYYMCYLCSNRFGVREKRCKANGREAAREEGLRSLSYPGTIRVHVPRIQDGNVRTMWV